MNSHSLHAKSVAASRRSFLKTGAALGAAAALPSFFLRAADKQKKWPDNSFLQGNWTPVHEEITADNLKIIGKLPADLEGMFVRNGPNLQFPPKQNYHLFEGDGMIHGVRLRAGKASYRNRWVRTAAWQEENKANKALYSSILDPIDFTFLAKQLLAGKNPFPNRANTALIWHHGKLLALWEGGAPHEIKVPGLETVGEYNFGGALKHPCTAHPKVDPKTGEMMFHAYGVAPFQPNLVYSVADRKGKIIHTTQIKLPRPVMMHDLAITGKFTLFLDAPFVMDMAGAMLGKPPFKWEPKFGARIGVLPRHAAGDKVRWFEIKPCFVFHVFNAFEDGDEVNLYGCRYPSFPDFLNLNPPAANDQGAGGAEGGAPVAYRWRLNLKTGKTTEGALDEFDCEFPRVDDRLAGAKTRYGYGLSSGTALVKFDFVKDRNERHDFGKGRETGEGVFVPRKDGKNEDDGYLISFVYDHAERRSEMAIIDCRDFKKAVVARVLIPQRVPNGFHGMWLDDDVL